VADDPSVATAATRCVSMMLMVTPANRRRVIARG